MKSIFTTKVGMTQVIDADGVITPVTVLKAEENAVVQVKTIENDGYNAIQVGTVDKKEKNVKNLSEVTMTKLAYLTKDTLKKLD